MVRNYVPVPLGRIKRFALSLLFAAILFNFSFAQSDITRPTVVSVSPMLISLDAGTNISAVFSEAMNASTINGTTVELRNALTGAVISATVTYNSSTKTARLYPTSPLLSLLYTARVKGGSAGVKDLAGNPMSNDFSWSFLIIPLYDFTDPSILGVTPANGATGVPTSTQVTATFSEAMNAATINTSTFELRTPANVLVPSTVSYNASMRKATLIPNAPLAASTVYKAIIKGGSSGVRDQYGNAIDANYQWSFTTSTPTPVDIVPPQVSSVSPVNGASNVGINTTVMAVFNEAMNAATITSSTVQLFKGSVQVPATVSYNAATRTATLTPSSPLSYSTAYSAKVKSGAAGVKDVANNALVSDYNWNFSTIAPPDNIPPQVSSVSPADAAVNVPIATTVTATFNETMNSGTINGASVQLLDGSTVVPASVSYNAATRTVTLTPTSPLTNITTYTARVKGGVGGVKDVAGNGMTTDYNWSFTTVSVSLFGPNDLPSVPLIVDQPVELGMKFQSTVTGYVKGVRFYKATGNNGTHIGHLWSSAGQMLAEATFINETASGWQEVLFATPVPIASHTTYVVSYYSPLGMYGYTNSYFTSSVSNGPLRALADGEDGGNGVYTYAAAPVYPTNSFMSTNYYTDVLFAPGSIPDNTPPTVLAVSPPGSSSAITIGSKPSAVFSEAMNGSTINGSTVELRTVSGTALNAAVAYNGNSNSVILTPAAPLAYGTAYKVTIKGGTSGVKDAFGNPLQADYNWTFTTADALIAPAEGPGGPILVISIANNPFSRYPVEILRAEGLNEFAATDISAVTPTMLANYDVIVLGEMTLTSAHVTMLTAWVNAGGTLIAFKPSSLLNSLFGLSAASGTLSDKYLLVNTASGPGAGIVNQTIQFHGTANLHNIVGGSGAVSLATLYSDATTATSNPAVVMRHVGVNGGSVVGFTYDLAKSVVYTRQGNPAWAGQKRDGQAGPIRSDDLFFGNDPDADWIDFNKVAIPQADEQQRLLANIILQNNLHRKPLPRFWYLPRDLKAAIVMTGDDHAVNGTSERFEHFMTLGPNSAQDVADWKAVRGTSYMYPNTPISNLEAMHLQAHGFEIALHPHTECVDYTPASLQSAFSSQLSQFVSSYPGLLPCATNRTHCLAWSDWASTPKVERDNGMRLDVTYYNWPEVWMQNIPGMFTGSGMPMRFADSDGSIIDVYQAPTQMTDETNMNYTAFCNAVLDKAVGPEGYYGVFTTNMHTDQPSSEAAADAIIASAQARQIPVISAQQLLTWLDARNGSYFSELSWINNKLTFKVTARRDARSLKAMLPMNAGSGQLMSIVRNGNTVPFTVQTIKGMQYAFFAVEPGTFDYIADYGGVLRTTAAPVTSTQNAKGAVSETTESPAAGELFVKAMPNPSVGYFNIVINSNDANPVTVRVLDITGRVVEAHQKIASSGILRLGHNWGAGSYFAEVIQGNQKKIVKLVKVN